MTFDLITKPKNNRKSEILFWEILKISHDDGTLTQEILDNSADYENYQKKIYSQFEIKFILDITSDSISPPSHPDQPHPCIPSMCLCTQIGLKFHCYIQNRITDETCWVGSHCIRKFFVHEIPALNKKISQKKNSELGNTCHYCCEGLFDLRKHYQNMGYCDCVCYRKMTYPVPFGKYKNKLLVELLNTREGKNYVDNFINVERGNNSNAFSRYPLFLEILDETLFEVVS